MKKPNWRDYVNTTVAVDKEDLLKKAREAAKATVLSPALKGISFKPKKRK